MLFAGLGFLTRVIRIQYPKNTVFNENIYGKYINNYKNGIFFNDVSNPPLSKLIMAGIALLARYDGKYSFEPEEQYPTMFYVMLRLIPAFFGSLCVPLSYSIMRVIGVGHLGSSAAAVLVSCDLVMIVEARHFMSDGIVHFFAVLAILSIFLYERFETFTALFLEGICCGLAAACKYTTGGVVLLALIRQFPWKDIGNRQFFFKNSGKSFVRCTILLIVVIFLHIFFFSIHLSILPYLPNDPPFDIPKIILDSLVSKENCHGNNETRNCWIERNQRMKPMILRVLSLIFSNHKQNMNIGYSNTFASPWYRWPLCNGKWVEVWEEGDQRLICLGNLFVWYPVFFGIIISIGVTFYSFDFSSNRSGMLFGYILSFLPFVLIQRDLYVFHYVIPLLFGIYNLLSVVDYLFSERSRGFVCLMMIHLALIGYFVWNPLVYGKHVHDFQFLIWNKNSLPN